ncbi:putative bifunctional diguanylate cyclase/phosphodiesterase [Clostridium ganghwense]|uniref:Bifunctional diguanylate cyclase/phosphodiesterase n=1 Tax=Clostridium ganghwense TaxID=312089 RepID=A0ABT4CK65_9CLOT|nr:bifunctional diguanylate cyclase/phosphodiesterase [Clostridium ganghwense]MCY6369439.1 bifunctional diguanylate cyclase/phosphodiesterase [Clostridium ganghwense]
MNETMIILIFGIVSYMFMGYLFTYLYKDSGLKYLLELSFIWYCCSCIFLIDAINEAILIHTKELLINDILTYLCCFLLLKAMYTFIKTKLPNVHKYILIFYIINILIFFIMGMILFEKQIYGSCIFASIVSSGLLIIFCNWKLKESRKYTIGNIYIFVGSLSHAISMVKQSDTIWDIWTFVSIISILVIGIGVILCHYEKVKSELKYYAYHDSLTGFFNKKTFVNKLNEELKKARKYNRKCALFCIDFDNFKLVNDTLGHAYGDEFLKSISKELKRCVNKDDIISRFGGDEFNILQKNIKGIDEVRELVNKILEKFKNPVVVDDYAFDVTASIGIIIYPDDACSSDELLKKADIAMYKAKSNGKNQYKFFKSYMNEELKRKMHIQKKLKEAVENNSFSVYYQPQINTRTANISGIEALVRWINPEEGIISPNEFIPLAEENGLILPISEFVLRTACNKSKQWNTSRSSKLSISVNVSVIQLNQKDFVDIVKKIIEETGVDPQYLILEITENILIKSLECNIRKLEKLRKLGVKIALDDFGKGYSSLSYIMDLPIDILKIDKCFVDDIVKNSKKQYIIHTIISLAQKINVKVVAEGVEIKEQYDILMKQNCDKIQGYYFSKPLSEEAFEELYVLSENEKIRTAP